MVQIKEVKVPYPVEKIVEKKIPHPYPVIKEVKVPVYIQSHQKHQSHNNQQQSNQHEHNMDIAINNKTFSMGNTVSRIAGNSVITKVS